MAEEADKQEDSNDETVVIREDRPRSIVGMVVIVVLAVLVLLFVFANPLSDSGSTDVDVPDRVMTPTNP